MYESQANICHSLLSSLQEWWSNDPSNPDLLTSFPQANPHFPVANSSNIQWIYLLILRGFTLGCSIRSILFSWSTQGQHYVFLNYSRIQTVSTPKQQGGNRNTRFRFISLWQDFLRPRIRREMSLSQTIFTSVSLDLEAETNTAPKANASHADPGHLTPNPSAWIYWFQHRLYFAVSPGEAGIGVWWGGGWTGLCNHQITKTSIHCSNPKSLLPRATCPIIKSIVETAPLNMTF